MRLGTINRMLFATLLLGSAFSVSEIVSQTNFSVKAQVVANQNASSSRNITIVGNQYSSAFTKNGSASIQGPVATLTQDSTYEVGNTILNNKLDMNQSFTLLGKVNLGNKSKLEGGADGISFNFQPGDTSTIGTAGNAMGIGGIKNSFGFKLDSFYNPLDTPDALADPPRFATADNGNFASFGAFIDGTTGTVATVDAGAQVISQPENNEFKDISVSYNGTNKVMTVVYDGKTWSQDLTTMIGSNDSMSFSINGSTGLHTNLQQFSMTSFTYTVAQGKVISHYVDESGNAISDDVTQSGDLKTDWSTSQKEIPGYTFKEVQGSTNGQYTANDQNVTYVYTRNQGTANVTFIDDASGKTLATKNLQGGTGEKSDYATTDSIKDYENKGYELVSDDFPSDGVTFSADAQHYTVHLKHKATTITPSQPGEPGMPINPEDSDGPKWPNGTNKDALTKTIIETIHYAYEDGAKAAEDVTDTSTFNNEIVIDNVTGEIIKDNGWTNADKDYFSQKDSPIIDGYTPSKVSVGRIDGLTQNSKDIEEMIIYTKNPISPITPPIDPSNPVTLTTPTSPSLPEINGGTGTAVNTGISQVKPSNSITPITPATPTLPEINGGVGTAVNTGISQAIAKQDRSASLPNTGLDTTTNLSILGALIAVSGAVGYFTIGRKQHK